MECHIQIECMQSSSLFSKWSSGVDEAEGAKN
jgi:hypothetical protein